MSAANDSATPSTKSQVRRRLTALSCHAGGFRSAIGETARQFPDDADAFSRTLMAVQRAISSTVRPQPRHSPERASSVQILTQGVSIIVGLGVDSAANIDAAGGNAILTIRCRRGTAAVW